MDDDPIPISLVANYMFCPRRAWLEAVGGKLSRRRSRKAPMIIERLIVMVARRMLIHSKR